MTRIFTLATASALALFALGEAGAQTPIRSGLRATGQAAGNVVEGTARATGNVLRGTAQATGDVLRGTAQTTRDVVTAPFGGTNDGRYAAGYRGTDAGYAQPAQGGYYGGGQYAQQQGPAHRLYTDHQGREYICDNGRRVYVTSTSAQGDQPTQANATWPNDQRADQATWNQQQNQQGQWSNQGVQGATYNQSQPPTPPQPSQGTFQGQGSAQTQGAQGVYQNQGAIERQANYPDASPAPAGNAVSELSGAGPNQQEAYGNIDVDETTAPREQLNEPDVP